MCLQLFEIRGAAEKLVCMGLTRWKVFSMSSKEMLRLRITLEILERTSKIRESEQLSWSARVNW